MQEVRLRSTLMGPQVLSQPDTHGNTIHLFVFKEVWFFFRIFLCFKKKFRSFKAADANRV